MSYFSSKEKKGTRVWSFQYGWGTIEDVVDAGAIDESIISSGLVLKVKFDNKQYDTSIFYYTLDGVMFETYENQTLFYDEVKYEIPKKPNVELTDGEYLICLNDNIASNDKHFKSSRVGNFSIENGLFRNDKITVKLALKQIKKFTKLLALRDQECELSRNHMFEEGEINYYISYSDKYSVKGERFNNNPTSVYFITEEDAQKVCDILNEGRFEL